MLHLRRDYDANREGGSKIHSHERDTIVPVIIILPMGEIRTIWDELCKYCVGDNTRVELLA